MAKDNKFRGAVYNQPKPSAAQELQEALEQVRPEPAPEPALDTASIEQEDELVAPGQESVQDPLQDAPKDAAGLEDLADPGSEPESIESALGEPLYDESASGTLLVEIPEPVPDAPAALEPAPVPQAPDPQPQQKAPTRIMKSVERDLVSYMEAVHPKQAVTEEVGGAWQHSLFQTFKRILSTPEPDAFREQWTTLLGFFHKHRDEMFNENFMFRFQSTWKGSAKDYTTFRHLVYLVIRTANPQTRQKEIREIVLERITQGLDAQSATNLVNFYA